MMVQYDPQWVRKFYNEFGEKEWERWDKTPVEKIKFFVHLHYIKEYISKGDNVLEIGAGAGRFTREISKITDNITVGDISSVQLKLNKENAEKFNYSKSIKGWIECDMCNLKPFFSEKSFDVIVCYGGPLSYVFDQSEQALSELYRILKPGGFLLLSVMNLWGTIHHFLPGILQMENEINRKIIKTGNIGPGEKEASEHYCHYYTSAELKELLEKKKFKIQVLSASNNLTASWDDILEKVEVGSEKWNFILEMELEACRQPGCLNGGTHMIAVVKK